MNKAIINALFAFVFFISTKRARASSSLEIAFILYILRVICMIKERVCYLRCSYSSLQLFSRHSQALILLYLRRSFQMEMIKYKKRTKHFAGTSNGTAFKNYKISLLLYFQTKSHLNNSNTCHLIK